MSDPITRLGLNCPKGGTFYICQDSKARFVGCCTSDPCADGSGVCPTQDLRYSSYKADQHFNVPKEACSSTGTDGGLWYTCQNANPPFMGCCTSNPCNDGCPASNLRGAVLGAAESEYGAFTTAKASSTVATASTSAKATSSYVSGSSSSQSATTTGTAAGGTTGAANAQPSPTITGGSSGTVTLSGGAIAGICVGIAVVVCVLVAIVFYMCGQKARDRKSREAMSVGPVSGRSWSPFLDNLSPTMAGRPDSHHVKNPALYSPNSTPNMGTDPGYQSGASPPMSDVESSWLSVRDSGASQYPPPHRGHMSTGSGGTIWTVNSEDYTNAAPNARLEHGLSHSQTQGQTYPGTDQNQFLNRGHSPGYGAGPVYGQGQGQGAGHGLGLGQHPGSRPRAMSVIAELPSDGNPSSRDYR